VTLGVAARVRAAGQDQTTVLAFDFGTRWTGVAVGERESGLAHPLAAIEAKAAKGRLDAIGRLIAEWRPTHLVVGLPLTLDGGEHPLGAAVRQFGHELQERFCLPVIFVDERLTSSEAESVIRASGRGGRAHKDLLHPAAAQRILQDYFNDGASGR
jgi:putative Holliday junction resolvase